MAIKKLPMPAARKLANLSQKDMADICDVSESTIANWEKFKTEPTIAQAYMFAEACGLDIDDVLFLPEVTV